VNYLSPEVRSDPWTDGEDRVLLHKINELGFCWSSIAHCFNGRSDNDIKNRWYSHLKYETRQEGGKFVFAAASDSLYPERKRRNRAKIYPKQNALRFLECHRESIVRVVPLPLVPRGAAQAQEDSSPWAFETEESVDRMIADECTDCQFSDFALFE
jgi:hypothetical protein